jgi:hypothetical protein
MSGIKKSDLQEYPEVHCWHKDIEWPAMAYMAAPIPRSSHGGGFFLDFVTCRNDVLVLLLVGKNLQRSLKPSRIKGLPSVLDPIFSSN